MKIHHRGFLLFLFLPVLLIGNLAAADTVNPELEVTAILQKNAEIPRFQGDLTEQAKFPEWFRKPLSLQKILWIALNRNPELKAKLAEAPITVAEMKQLGLVESPELDFLTHVPVDSPGFRTEYGVSATQNIMDLIQRPSRKRVGKAEYESKKWEISAELLSLLTQVKISYYDYQAALQLRAFRQADLSAAQSAAGLAQGQWKAGNISVLDEAQRRAFLQTAQLEYAKSVSEAKQARIRLAKLAGIPWDHSQWKIVEKLPHLPARDPKLERLKEWAKLHRPDLVAQKYKIESKEQGVQLARRAYLPKLNAGISADWDPEGNQGLGPTVALGLPLLGHRKIGIQKAQADLNASRQLLSAMEQNIPYDFDQLYQQLLLARQSARFYETEILPVQRRILEESLKHYNYMLLSNYQLLQNKQNQIEAQRNYIQALRDYWIAYAGMENLLGGAIEGLEREK
ncbi:MAG TPA: hypothetical protein DF383_06690 [Deltaproteobacteria bacterium]|nr:hypothetical protein [Deltaproteobacteria bacterium]